MMTIYYLQKFWGHPPTLATLPLLPFAEPVAAAAVRFAKGSGELTPD